MSTFLHDARYGFRLLIKNPAYTTIAVLTLALGIGANTAIFSVVNGVLLRPLPYPDGDRLVVLRQSTPLAGDEDVAFSVKEIQDVRDQNRTLAGLAEYHSMSFILLGNGEGQRVSTGVVSHDFFELLGVKPLLGRTFVAGDEGHGAAPVLVVSHDYWMSHLGGDPAIVGKTFKMNDKVHTVVGVLPPFPQYPEENDVYMPTTACPFRGSQQMQEDRTARMMSLFGRLKSGAGVERARAEMLEIEGRLKSQYPEAYPASAGFTATAEPLKEELTRRAEPTLLVLLATAGFVLIIACANVANLALSRMLRREREMAVRSALGASRKRLLRQLLTESALLSIAGGALGLMLAAWGLDLLVAFASRFTTRAHEVRIDGTVLVFTLLASLGTAIVFGSLPALPSGRGLFESIKEGSQRTIGAGSRGRLRAALVVAQVGVSFVLLIGAGLLLRSLANLQRVDPGFRAERVLTMRLPMNWSKYNTNDLRRAVLRDYLGRIQSVPGVESAALAMKRPLNDFGPFNRPFRIEGQPAPIEGELRPTTDFHSASPDYFRILGMPLLRGRFFEDGDDEKAPQVAIINDTMARHRFGGDEAVGRRVTFDDGKTWVTIVGVVADIREYALDREAGDAMYQPVAQSPTGSTILLKTAVEPLGVTNAVREAIHKVDPEQAIDGVRTLEQIRHESIASPRLTAILLTLFAALALVITVAGISGAMALTVSQRTGEIGIRMALGATRAGVVTLMMRQGLILVAAGLAMGAAVAVGLSHLMSSLLFGIGPNDPLTFTAVAGVLFAGAAAACWVPARRATAVDPMSALRSD